MMLKYNVKYSRFVDCLLLQLRHSLGRDGCLRGIDVGLIRSFIDNRFWVKYNDIRPHPFT